MEPDKAAIFGAWYERGAFALAATLAVFDDHEIDDLSGIEGDRTWSAMILDDGAMTVTVAAEKSGFVVFWQCLPADKTRP